MKTPQKKSPFGQRNKNSLSLSNRARANNSVQSFKLPESVKPGKAKPKTPWSPNPPQNNKQKRGFRGV